MVLLGQGTWGYYVSCYVLAKHTFMLSLGEWSEKWHKPERCLTSVPIYWQYRAINPTADGLGVQGPTLLCHGAVLRGWCGCEHPCPGGPRLCSSFWFLKVIMFSETSGFVALDRLSCNSKTTSLCLRIVWSLTKLGWGELDPATSVTLHSVLIFIFPNSNKTET